MQYMGGKGRIAGDIAAVMRERIDWTRKTDYLEPFVGGGWVLPHMVSGFSSVRIGDAHRDLIMLWSALREGWVPPDHVSKDEYDALRIAQPSPLRAFVGFGLSFGGKFFGGYASNARGDDFCGAAKRGLTKKTEAVKQADEIFQLPFWMWSVGPETVVYCDPPYANTTGYSQSGDWDPDWFWFIVQSWANQGAQVFVSEYSAPLGTPVLWEREVRSSLKKDDNKTTAVERLYEVSR